MAVKTYNPEELKALLIKGAAKATREDAAYVKKNKLNRQARVFTYNSVVPSCYKVKAGIFVANRWTFDPKTMEAYSFRWWAMLTVIKGKLVRNRCNYSSTTSRHQNGLDRCLKAMGIKPDVTLSVRSPITSVRPRPLLSPNVLQFSL